MKEKEFTIEVISHFFDYGHEGYGEILYKEREKSLFLSGDMFLRDEPDSKGSLYLNSVFKRFNPPHDDECISDTHWQTISKRIAEHFNCKVTLECCGAKFREDVWRVFLDRSVKGVYRWHDRGKEMDLRPNQTELSTDALIEIVLEPEPKWLNGTKLTDEEISRMKSYVKEMIGGSVRFIEKT